MKAGFHCIVFFLSFTLLCCSPTGTVKPAQRDFSGLGISQLREFVVTRAKKDSVVNKLGKPNHVVSLSEDEEAWIYLEVLDGNAEQRISLVFDRKRDFLLTATWTPRLSEPLRNRKSALSHFEGSHFKAKVVGWIARHEYSDEENYIDSENGISILANKSRQSVSAISFSMPTIKPNLIVRK